jgi:DNA-binding XRE family transcriptional regulator
MCILHADQSQQNKNTMLNSRKLKQSQEIIRLMEKHNITNNELARELKVTSQTIYNVKKGEASIQLIEHALLILDNWEES